MKMRQMEFWEIIGIIFIKEFNNANKFKRPK